MGGGKALAALVFAGISVLVAMVAVAILGTDGGDEDDADRIDAHGDLAVTELRAGDCFLDPRGDAYSVTAVPCPEPHDLETFAVFDIGGGRITRATTRSKPVPMPDPDKDAWEDFDDREVMCAVGIEGGEADGVPTQRAALTHVGCAACSTSSRPCSSGPSRD